MPVIEQRLRSQCRAHRGLRFAGANVTFEVTSGPGTLDPENALTDANGEANTTLSSNVTGTSTVTASTTVHGIPISTPRQ